MMRVLSPHLDDAVLSLGQFMASIACEVVTLFAGEPGWPDRPGYVTPYDAARGFETSSQSVRHRRSEDHAAMASLRGRVLHLDYLDGQYVGELDVEPLRGPRARTAMTEELRGLMSPKEHFFAPLGLGHPDHRYAAKVARDACVEGELLVYEELPYRVESPEEVWRQLKVIRSEGFTIDPLTWPPPVKLTPEHLERKKAAIALYRSQFPEGAVDPCLLVPERIWRITR